MTKLLGKCLMSIENECLTVVDGVCQDSPDPEIFRALLDCITRIVPSLRSITGVANGYGIIYPDIGHLELAACECDSPYLLPTVVEQQQLVVREALNRLKQEQNIRLILANNNYTGLFQPRRCSTWGAHSNYLVEEQPRNFGERILPFLATRIFAGAGVVQYPNGFFLASSRAPWMECDAGGGTIESRAIHSTARDENHMNGSAQLWRYHLICGDGHRSHFNLALQCGATAAALKAIFFNPRLHERLPAFCRNRSSLSWIDVMQEFNLLAKPGEPLKVDHRAIAVQRVYLEGARAYAASQNNIPAWLPRLLADWEATLRAMEKQDDDWLASRLDAWAKHALFTQVLAGAGYGWKDLLRVPHLFEELALLDQNYHEFTNSQSIFYVLEQQKLLKHRLADPVQPGGEFEPYVPDTATRARARAQFIRDHAGKKNYVVDWGWVTDTDNRHYSRLSDPFSQSYGPWESPPPEVPALDAILGLPISILHQSASLEQLDRDYQRGAYNIAHEHLTFLERVFRRTLQTENSQLLRYRAWIQSRRGQNDGIAYLDVLYHDLPVNLIIVSDYVFAYRFRSLDLPPEVQPWLRRGRELLEQAEADVEESWERLTFREHLAYSLIHEEKAEEAIRVLAPIWRMRNVVSTEPRIQGRALATLGNAYRLTGRRRKACICLSRAEHILNEHDFSGDLADFAWIGMAKLERSRSRALQWLEQAKQIQQELGSPVGLTRSLLIEARRCCDAGLALNRKNEIVRLRSNLPGLQNCLLLERILANWDRWISELGEGNETDTFWGL